MNQEQRDKEGHERGFADALEASIVRSEAKLHAANNPDPEQPLVYLKERDGTIQGVERAEDDRARDREDGWERWKDHVTQRFLDQLDTDFDYASVDDNDVYDDHEEQDRGRLDEYLAKEEEEFVSDGPLTGETGIQDY